jgi:predicted phosphodiesterase
MEITSSWRADTNPANPNKKQIISISGHTHFAYDFMRDDVRYINSGAWGFHLP